ncbi:MAG: hypothetical protein VX798_07880 [Bacteroidota bacterium]|uniref:Secreted protein n=1 Tax=Flagellimonas profundi TaxID=2915620 RepID=A0ABS3FF56_9FLAO|nr:hypothetical protein [Allomuricauda profundi]MBO0341201.1 hypothetical protein [Allomuricauda profundi]MEC7771086.1 hypothetical protein [Bacteroidota bacterium]
MLRTTLYLPVSCIMFLNVTDTMVMDNQGIQTNEERISTFAKRDILIHQVRIGIENKSRRRLASSLSDERQL